MEAVCQICDYKINKTVRRLVKCPYCEFESCRTCCEKYILGETIVKCMNVSCGREWTRQHISATFTGVFINKNLKERREHLLFEQERALMPATQPVVEARILRDKLYKEGAEIQYKINELVKMRNKLYSQAHTTTGVNSTNRSEFIRSCPDTNCRGFLSTQWKCGVCEKWACSSCHEIKGLTRDVEHTCNPDTVATVSLLANDTRPCPNCREGIFKIDGCDQMWCTKCHTAFNWRTGRTEASVHNPHYFEWLRRNGNEIPRNPADIPCQTDLTHNTFVLIRNILRERHIRHPEYKIVEETMAFIVRNTLHLRHVLLPRYNVGHNVADNQELRVKYMLKYISELEFKTILQKDEKKRNKSQEIYHILELLMNTVTEIIVRFKNEIANCEPNQMNVAILNEIKVIVQYANTCLRDVSKAYSCKPIHFSDLLMID